MFDETTKVGGITFDPGNGLDVETTRICDLLCAKIIDHKEANKALEDNSANAVVLRL
jgi:hypothetical protein